MLIRIFRATPVCDHVCHIPEYTYGYMMHAFFLLFARNGTV